MNIINVKLIAILGAGIVASLISGCTAPTVDTNLKLAVLSQPSTESTQVISQAMTTALNGKKVTLIATAFTKKPRHTLEKRMFTDINSDQIDGLILDLPAINSFTLFTSNDACYLIHENSGKRFALNNLECKAL